MTHVFLHGLGQSAESWAQTVQAMGEEALCPGLSRWLGPEGYPDLYRGLETYCDALDAPLCLCGLSLGGILALQYTIEHPDRVQALALIGIQYAMPKGMLRLQNALFRLMPERSFSGMGMRKKGTIALCRSMMDLDFTAGLGKVRCPTLILCGEKDKTNRKAAQGLKDGIPNSELAFLPGAGHEVNVDAPAELGERLCQFLH